MQTFGYDRSQLFGGVGVAVGCAGGCVGIAVGSGSLLQPDQSLRLGLCLSELISVNDIRRINRRVGIALPDELIEIHHVQPLVSYVGVVNPATALAPVCANCDAMLHRDSHGVMPVEELHDIVARSLAGPQAELMPRL